MRRTNASEQAASLQAFGEKKQSVGRTLSTLLLDALTEPKTIVVDIGARTP